MKQVTIKVTVVDPDTHDGARDITFSGYTDIEVTEEKGIRHFRTDAGSAQFVPNGFHTLRIKAWAGYKDFDSFAAEEKR